MAVIRLIFALVMMVATLPTSAGERRPPSVLILEHSDPGTPFFIKVSETFRTALRKGSDVPVSVYSESLDLGRFGGPRHEELLQALYREKYARKPIGAIVAVGRGALSFALRTRDEMWPGVPIVFSAVDHETVTGLNVPSDVTGTTIRLSLRDLVASARAVVPGLRQVALLGDPLDGQAYRRHFTGELRALAGELDVS